MFNISHLKKAKGHAEAATKAPVTSAKSSGYISLMALVMMNVTIIGSVANDVQQAYYGLSSITLFIIGAIVFFLPTGLVAAELASGWSQRGGIFRWVGEAMGPGLAFACLLVLWFQTSINFGSGVATASTTMGFYTPDWDWAKAFVNQTGHGTLQVIFMIGWLAFYWLLTWISTKGVKAFARLTKYGVLIGTFIPLAFMVIMCVVYLATGHQSNITVTPEAFNPFSGGFKLATLSLAAGVFFSFAGIDMNAAHIKQLKNPQKEFTKSIFICMALTLVIFIAGTLVIAIVTPVGQMNLVYGLFQTYKILGDTIGIGWVYVLFAWAGLGASIASLVTNMAGPSYMLGQAGRSGFLPPKLQSNNKHGMPSKLMYLQMAFMTVIAFLFFLIPNIQGFVILITQSITILYMLYYVLMFISFLKLRHDQPNRPRGFKVPGGKIGAYVVAGVGLAACVFGIVLAIIPPAQISAGDTGGSVTYVGTILGIIAGVLVICFALYRWSKKNQWADPENQFAPFTWQIEGLKKPEKVSSNVPTALLSEGQNPMGLPIKKLWNPNEQIPLTAAQAAGTEELAGDDPAAINHPVKTNGVSPTAPGAVSMSQPPLISEAAGIGTSADAGVKSDTKAQSSPVAVEQDPDLPPVSAEAVRQEHVPQDPVEASKRATAAENKVESQIAAEKAKEEKLQKQAAALKNEEKADSDLASATREVKEAQAEVKATKAEKKTDKSVTESQQVTDKTKDAKA